MLLRAASAAKVGEQKLTNVKVIKLLIPSHCRHCSCKLPAKCEVVRRASRKVSHYCKACAELLQLMEQ